MNSPKLYGLLGYPIRHSLSPRMHNAAFRTLGIEAEYRLFEVVPADLSSFLGTLDASGISGLNVTIPYKEKVLDFVELDAGSSHLRSIGAVNTMVKVGGTWKGYNTDIPGFERHLKEQCEVKGRRVALLGAGGASRAVSYALAGAGARQIRLFDVDSGKSAAVCAMIRGLFPDFDITAVAGVAALTLAEQDILINTTPVGVKESDPLLIAPEQFHKDLFVYDLIYNPAETRLLQEARRAGARTSNGLGMLLYQGMLAFEKWTGRSAPQEVMAAALKEGLGR